MALEGKVTPQFFGPYQVHELIGRGGMGEVHRAYDGVRKRTVALKRLRPEFSADERFRARFLRECQRVAPLAEAHVIPIHDYGEFDGRLFLDMRLIEGDNLAHRLATQGPLPSHLAVGIIVQVGAALDAAHAAGLVHRDVKPSNVLVSDDGPVLHCYLADFGVAGAVGGSGGISLTLTRTTVGTVDYIAPERTRRRTVPCRQTRRRRSRRRTARCRRPPCRRTARCRRPPCRRWREISRRSAGQHDAVGRRPASSAA